MFNLGDKVVMDNNKNITGYIVSMEIVAEDEEQVFEQKQSPDIIYTIRHFYDNGMYTDFKRMEDWLKLA